MNQYGYCTFKHSVLQLLVRNCTSDGSQNFISKQTTYIWQYDMLSNTLLIYIV